MIAASMSLVNVIIITIITFYDPELATKAFVKEAPLVPYAFLSPTITQWVFLTPHTAC